MKVFDDSLSIEVYGDLPMVRPYTVESPDYLEKYSGVDEVLGTEGQRLLEEGLEDSRAGRVVRFDEIRRELDL